MSFPMIIFERTQGEAHQELALTRSSRLECAVATLVCLFQVQMGFGGIAVSNAAVDDAPEMCRAKDRADPGFN